MVEVDMQCLTPMAECHQDRQEEQQKDREVGEYYLQQANSVLCFLGASYNFRQEFHYCRRTPRAGDHIVVALSYARRPPEEYPADKRLTTSVLWFTGDHLRLPDSHHEQRTQRTQRAKGYRARAAACRVTPLSARPGNPSWLLPSHQDAALRHVSAVRRKRLPPSSPQSPRQENRPNCSPQSRPPRVARRN